MGCLRDLRYLYWNYSSCKICNNLIEAKRGGVVNKTGEELTKLFFTKVKRWRYIDNQWVEFPEGKPNALVLNWSENYLPKLHLSLDLQEEWVWPELSKIISFEFCPRRNAKNPDEK